MLEPQHLRNRDFTMATWRKLPVAAAPADGAKRRRTGNPKLHCGMQSINHNSLLRCNMENPKLEKIEAHCPFDSHFQQGKPWIANVAEKLQTIKIVVWAI
jgi:hypothetical protein